MASLKTGSRSRSVSWRETSSAPEGHGHGDGAGVAFLAFEADGDPAVVSVHDVDGAWFLAQGAGDANAAEAGGAVFEAANPEPQEAVGAEHVPGDLDVGLDLAGLDLPAQAGGHPGGDFPGLGDSVGAVFDEDLVD